MFLGLLRERLLIVSYAGTIGRKQLEGLKELTRLRVTLEFMNTNLQML